ncbi:MULTISPECIES: recombinase family protein [unclassified Caballeronia]|uniref:recombinase family protein n=1 Tax=unclassified Caballeronia TaxID=2646786 RepID=UPI0028624A24|nr:MULTISPECIES: recombinase family protein [unclassified Caballeronia]MDR5751090.1 recombinase family protein [Caballeronia sp. LZ024]MDR5844773.1 recombinase family protein [Caballeronia sp. LZ031]
MRTFLYSRVSTQDQDTTNQQIAARHAGYDVEPRRVHAETISGTVPAMERPVFRKLVEKLEQGDTLVVTKLDRLGRNAADVDSTVTSLRAAGIRVVVLDLPVQEVTSAAGDLVRRMFAAFAQFERDLIVERTHAGLERARASGRVGGRPERFTLEEKRTIKARLDAGATARGLAKEYRTTHVTIMKAAKEASAD